jgi:hypothetical protein
MSTQNSVDGEALLSQITRHVFIVLLRISWPKMAYQITDAIVEVEGDDNKKVEIAEEFRSKPQWQLCPAEFKDRLQHLESRARSLVYNASIQFAAKGMAVLPVTRAGEIFAGLRACRAEMAQCCEEFVASYENILKALEEKLEPSLYARAIAKLPTKEALKNKFGIVWAIVPCGNDPATAVKLNEIRSMLVSAHLHSRARQPRAEITLAVQLLDELRTQAVQQATDDEADELIREARQQMNQFTQEMLQDISREPRKILADATDNLIQALADPERSIRTGTIDQVRRAFELVEGFSFLAGSELLSRMRAVRDRLEDATPQDLNRLNAQAGASLADALRGVRDIAADAQQASEAMRQFRGIRIRNPVEAE